MDTFTGKLDHNLIADWHLSSSYARTYVPRINIGNAFSPSLATGHHQNVGSL
jgi:hypothetical protein